ncbi:uncharacterized protein LOC131616015 [Vicia villosa]|uniref:uncharacterized protein LOC131616015 n=1 Tax=Vicia villosa TaxID=3911 RepID=UPI00273AFFDB|nr:uncharacterized protein LOC131616015 [Vicia villosa]
MDQLEQNQAALREEVDQLKVSMEEVKGGMTQMLEFMKALLDKQDKAKEVQSGDTLVQDEIPNDKNPLLGFVSGFGPDKDKSQARSVRRAIQFQEKGEASQEGFVPTPQTKGTTRTVRIPASNVPKDDDYLDLQYGVQEVDNSDQVPQTQQSIPNSREDSKGSEQIKALEERLKVIEGYDVFDVDAFEMSLVSDFTIPRKFKIPDFEKYKGLTCPRNHLRMYVRKMAAYARDQKLMIHFFQESLSGASIDWYMQLEKSSVRSWNDLANTFLKHYKYNLDMAPDRMQLQNMSQKKDESFKEYAQRWREMASRVQPPLMDKELVDIFMSTLQGPYYDKMVGSISSGFSNLVVIGERIEDGIKNGKIQGAPSGSYQAKKSYDGKKEPNTVGAILVNQTPTLQQKQQGGQRPWRSKPKRSFTPLHMPLSQALQHLLSQNLVTLLPPYSAPANPAPGYKHHARCAYHSDSPGHDTEDCGPLKHKIQDLIEEGLIEFEDPSKSNTIGG